MNQDHSEHNKTKTDAGTNDSLGEELSSSPTERRDPPLFLLALKLVAIGIILYVSLNHLDKIGGALQWLYSVFSPLLTGVLLAFVLNTPMCALERLLSRIFAYFGKTPRKRLISTLALTLTFLIAILIIVLIGNTIIPQVIDSLTGIIQKVQNNLPRYIEMLTELERFGVDTDSLAEWISSIDLNAIIQKITDNAMSIIGTVASSATSIVTWLFTAITAVVFAIYILANKKVLGEQLFKIGYAYGKKSMVDKAGEICAMTAKTFSQFISGQCLDACILGILCFITMTIFRFPYALAISALITVTAIIPYIGAFLGVAFGVLLMILDDPIRALLFVVLFIVVQQIDNHLIYPRVVGNSVGLPAIWTFAAVIVGGGVFGVVGMVLFIPLFSVVYTLIRSNVHNRLTERGISVDSFHSEEDEPCDGGKGFDFSGLKENLGKLESSFLGWLRGKTDRKNDSDGDKDDKTGE